MDSSDSLLASRLLRGDEEAFDQFFERAFGPVYQQALTRTGGDEDAAEAVAKATLCSVFRNPGTIPPRGHVEVAGIRKARLRSAVHAEWQAETTRRAQKRVFTALVVAAVLAAIVIWVNCAGSRRRAPTPQSMTYLQVFLPGLPLQLPEQQSPFEVHASPGAPSVHPPPPQSSSI